jgi:hypothetical protein
MHLRKRSAADSPHEGRVGSETVTLAIDTVLNTPARARTEDEPGGPARPTPDFEPAVPPEPDPEPGRSDDEPGGPARPTPDFEPAIEPEPGSRHT